MFIGKFLTFAGFFGRFFVLVRGEKILPAGFLGRFWLWPEPVHKVKVRAKRRKRGGNAAGQNGKEAVSLEFFDPGGKAGKAKHQHKDKGTDDLCLVFGGTPGMGIERRNVFHDGVKVQKPEFFAYSLKFKMEPCALGRIEMYFCLMQEIQIFLMGLPVN